jgi:lipopolysaccharide transport system ATP-binding protein
MKNDILIKVENVSKKFSRDLKKSLWYGIQDIGKDLIGSSNREVTLRQTEFWAVDNISFELRRGEVLGLIGRNGAGKTTLLKLLNGLTKPDGGRITMQGRVGALIALGAGFNPILTGRENVYVNGSVLGLSKAEIDETFDEIVNFAELWDFIDTPVQSYSSGMQVRLGFAIATTIKPDILLLDEVLAVGDAAFRNKCYSQIGKLTQNSAVIFVSHNLNDIVRICDRSLFLEGGKEKYFGSVEKGANLYSKKMELDQSDSGSFTKFEEPITKVSFPFKELEADYAEFLTVSVEIEAREGLLDAAIQIPFYDNQSSVVGEWYSKRETAMINLVPGRNMLNIRLGPLYLKSGSYKMALVLSDSRGISFKVWAYKVITIKINGPVLGAWPFQIKGELVHSGPSSLDN